MISHPEFNFVFVAVTKTASSSIRNRFRHIGAAPKKEPRSRSDVSFQHPQHYCMKDYRQILGDELDTRFTFGFVRNPWDRLVSNYTMLCNSWRNPQHPREGLQEPETFQAWAAQVLDPIYFDSESCYRDCGRHACKHYRTTAMQQLDWFTEDGEITVDFIGRFENVRADFEKILERINSHHPLPDRKFWELPHVNKSDTGNHYSFYYNDETIELVRERFRPDIEYFDYTYSGVAQAGRASGSDPEG